MTVTQYITAGFGVFAIVGGFVATGVRHGRRGPVVRRPRITDRALFFAIGALCLWLAVTGRVP